MTGRLGPQKIDGFPGWLVDTATRIAQGRKGRFGVGPYLVIQRDSDHDVILSQPREFDDFVVVFDAIDKDAVRDQTAPILLYLRTSLQFAVSSIDGFDLVSDSVVLTRDDGKAVFSYTFQVSGGRITNSPTVSHEVYSRVPIIYDKFIQHNKLTKRSSKKRMERVIRLLLVSLEQHEDRFRAFLFLWMALEIFVEKGFPHYEKAAFTKLLDASSEAQQHYITRMRKVMEGKYKPLDKFALIAAQLSPDNADQDLWIFEQATKLRNDLVHGQDVDAAELPAEATRLLIGRYLLAHLRASS